MPEHDTDLNGTYELVFEDGTHGQVPLGEIPQLEIGGMVDSRVPLNICQCDVSGLIDTEFYGKFAVEKMELPIVVRRRFYWRLVFFFHLIYGMPIPKIPKKDRRMVRNVFRRARRDWESWSAESVEAEEKEE